MNAESLNIKNESAFSIIEWRSLHKKVLSDLGDRFGLSLNCVVNNLKSPRLRLKNGTKGVSPDPGGSRVARSR
jgi:hypothetical protein